MDPGEKFSELLHSFNSGCTCSERGSGEALVFKGTEPYNTESPCYAGLSSEESLFLPTLPAPAITGAFIKAPTPGGM